MSVSYTLKGAMRICKTFQSNRKLDITEATNVMNLKVLPIKTQVNNKPK